MSDTAVTESQPAPDFTLPAVGSPDVVKDGKVQLSVLRNHVVVLYFYPRDDTPGCTAQPRRGLILLSTRRHARLYSRSVLVPRCQS